MTATRSNGRSTAPVIDTVLFDLDGTLIDPRVGITRCIQHALEHLGSRVPNQDDLLWCIGPPLRGSFARLLASDDADLIERAMTLYRERFMQAGIYENTLYPGVPDLLHALRAHGIRVMLATSKPHELATPILSHFELTPAFDAIYGSELDGTRGDKTELLAYIVAEQSLDPARCVMVGDRGHDIIGGRNNGMWTAAVAYGYSEAGEIAAQAPDIICDHPAALGHWLLPASRQNGGGG